MKGILGFVIAGAMSSAPVPEGTCRTYSTLVGGEEPAFMSVVDDVLYYKVEDGPMQQATCNAAICSVDGYTFTINLEQPGKFLVIDGEKWSAACQ
jgi:hypothetical protein